MKNDLIIKSRIFLVLTAFTLFFVTACKTTLPYEKTAQILPEKYVLAAGDKIDVTSPVAPDVEGEYVLSDEGFVDLPLIGQTKLAGLTSAEADQFLTEKYADGFLVNPDISIQIKNYRPFYILGEVENPGKYDYRDGMTILNAVAMAGGFTYRANQNKLELIRSVSSTSKTTQGKYEVNNLAVSVLPGDTIYVRERYF